MNLKDATRLMCLQYYETRGIKALDNKLLQLITECESPGYTPRQRSDIKGELAEVAVECHIREAQKTAVNLAYLKGLCFAIGSRTTEIDLLMCTPYCIYLFECKSFSGKKTLTDKCFLKGRSSSKDVYEQSKYHLDMLYKHLFPYLRNKDKSQPPFKLVLFEFSSDACEDKRTDANKALVPLLTLADLDSWLDKQLHFSSKPSWDFMPVLDKLKDMNSTSGKTFERHMERMIHKKHGK